MTPSILMWEHAGRPPLPGMKPVGGPCWLCGGAHGEGQPVKKAIPKTFIQAHEVARPESAHVCLPCIQALGKRKFAFPGRGKDDGGFGPAPCNLSHGFDGGVYWTATKGEKPVIRDAITRAKVAPWFIAVADSGQKHVLPFSRMQMHSSVAGVVRFETADVCVPEEAAEHVERVTSILDMGATKAEVETGAWSPRAWRDIGADIIRPFEAWARPLRGGGWWSLLIWICQRSET